MGIYPAVLLTVAVVVLVLVAIYAILAINEIRETSREAGTLIAKFNDEMDKVQHVTNAVSGLTGAVSGSIGRTVVTFATLMIRLMKARGEKSKSSHSATAEAVRERGS